MCNLLHIIHPDQNRVSQTTPISWLNSTTLKTSAPSAYWKSSANYGPVFSRIVFALPGKPTTCLTHCNMDSNSASLLLVDALEHARETHSACLVSSWDIRRAFNRIGKPALQMAWTRLGVPPQWVFFLIELDNDGTTTVRLPISQHAFDRTGLAGLHRLQALGATDILFPAARGSLKGTSQSHSAGMPYMIYFSVH